MSNTLHRRNRKNIELNPNLIESNPTAKNLLDKGWEYLEFTICINCHQLGLIYDNRCLIGFCLHCEKYTKHKPNKKLV